jgi:flagellin
MRINTNYQSMIGQRSLQKAVKESETSSIKLSSGNRVYTAALDPAGLAISEKLRAKSAGLSQAKRNANDSISLLQIAEGALDTVHNLGGRLKELALQAANDTLTERERQVANIEFQSIKKEIQRMQESVSYNGRKLMNQGSSFTMHVGAKNEQGDKINFNISKALRGVDELGIGSSSIATKKSSQNSLSQIDDMIQKVSESRSLLGSLSNRMNSAINNLMIDKESTEAAKTQIRDTDFAAELSAKASSDIRKNATTALLTSANQLPDKVARLLS